MKPTNDEDLAVAAAQVSREVAQQVSHHCATAEAAMQFHAPGSAKRNPAAHADAPAAMRRARKPTPYSDAYLLELRKVIQRTHPDKGGAAEAFHAAKERFDAAKARAAARNYRQFEDECERVMRWWPDAPPTSDEWGALMRGEWHGGRDALRRYRETKTQQAQPETKTCAATPETKTRNRGGRPPGVSAFAAWVLETKTPRASAYRQWVAFMGVTGETKTPARADADALAKFLRWRKA